MPAVASGTTTEILKMGPAPTRLRSLDVVLAPIVWLAPQQMT
jgi:hypothetical protein